MSQVLTRQETGNQTSAAAGEELMRVHGRPRILFGCAGWPTGMIDVASWAKNKGLADPVIFRMETFPTLLTELDPGVIRIVTNDAEKRMLQEEKARVEELTPKLREYAASRGRTGDYFAQDGTLRPEAVRAVAAVGSDFAEKLMDYKPHMVGFRLETDGMGDLKSFVDAVRFLSDAYVVVGGPTPTSHPKDVLEESGADYVFAGEAEATFNMFLKAVGGRDRNHRLDSADYGKLASIPGLAYRHGGRILHNSLPADGWGRTAADDASGAEKPGLMGLVRPTADGGIVSDNRLDWSILENFESSSFTHLHLTGGRGCPHMCVFCSRFHGNRLRVKTAAELVRDIEDLDAGVADGTVGAKETEIFRDACDPALKDQKGFQLTIFDEDFFLNRKRAVEFFKLWERHPLHGRYRLQFQTNPTSLLTSSGQPDEELMGYIQRSKAIVNIGVESFNEDLLTRLNKPHKGMMGQVEKLLDRFDEMGHTYGIYIIMSDHQTSPEEYIDSARRLVVNGILRRHMHPAISMCTSPDYDSELRKSLEFSGRLNRTNVRHYTDYYRTHPELQDPLTAKLVEASRQFSAIGHLPEGGWIFYSDTFVHIRRAFGKEYEKAKEEYAKAKARKKSGKKPASQDESAADEQNRLGGRLRYMRQLDDQMQRAAQDITKAYMERHRRSD